jgi:hypothetical protein
MGPNFVGLDKGFIADGEVGQFHVVVQTDVENCAEAANATTRPLGIAQDASRADDRDPGNRVLNIRMLGISRGVVAVASGLNIGDNVSANADGQLVASSAGNYVVGYLLTNPEQNGDHVDVMLLPGVQVPA